MNIMAITFMVSSIAFSTMTLSLYDDYRNLEAKEFRTSTFRPKVTSQGFTISCRSLEVGQYLSCSGPALLSRRHTCCHGTECVNHGLLLR